MAPLALPMMLAGTAVSAYGQHQAARAQAAESRYDAAMQERQARMTEQRTRFEQQRLAEGQARHRGAMTAQMGAAGAVMGAGAPMMIMGTQAREDELEQQMVGFEGRETAMAHRSAADMARARARSARTAGRIGVGTTLLHGFGSAFGS